MEHDDVLKYADDLAGRLKRGMSWVDSGLSSRGWWKAENPDTLSTILAAATEAIEFFRLYAGPDSFWTVRAREVFASKGEGQTSETGARAISDLLRGWIDQVGRGVVEIVGERVRNEVSGARMDLMGQVRQLLLDPNVHPAAPIVLCGAALEIALRALAQVKDVTVEDRPGAAELTKALRHARVITVQDVKDLDQCAGLRNLAAHGSFDELSRERAGVMEQQTSILLRRIAELAEAPLPAVTLEPAVADQGRE